MQAIYLQTILIMKKFFFSSFAIMAMMVAAIGLVSCGSDDDDNSGSGSDSKVSKAEIMYKVSLGRDMTKFLNVEIDYLDNGQKKTVKVTDQDWSVTTTTNSLPAKFGYKLRLSRNNVQLDESGNYLLGILVDKAYAMYNSKGERVAQSAFSGTINVASYNGANEKTKLTEEKLSKFIERYNSAFVGTFELNAEGKMVETGSDF